MIRSSIRLLFAFALTLAIVPSALAQDPDDAVLRPAEPEFALVSLPTALRLPQGGSAFRLTHRFSLSLNNSSSDEVFGRLFGIDSAAITGLEYRFGLMRNLQAGVHHSGDNRTWSFFGEYGLMRQTTKRPVDLTAVAAVDIPRVPKGAGFERQGSPSLTLIASRTFGEKAALYVEPAVVGNIYNEFPTVSSSNDALVVGLGARVLVRPTVSIVGEVVPRVAGFDANTTHAAFGLEKRAGGHVFQINFSNSFGTIMSQLAQGGGPANNWHLGFNLSRKFY